ncbi:outer membrane protein [Legionella yabuuchiae]|uniref:outer membrane protein n=1 Tax=Legionella yabuuchiae TaxID=376727 RepID=UPI0013EFB032|nr:outer membrane beta-barrel protein [Legionella yabuuchiae]
MKQYGLISAVALSLGLSTTYAANPMNGLYGGIILGGSYAPKGTINFNAPLTPNTTSCSSSASCAPASGTLAYSGYGNIGGQIGGRYNHFRVELEPVVNYNPYQKITIGTTTFTSPKSSTALRLEGSTTTIALMINAFYDFYTAHSQSDFVPYLGAGIGYANVDNSMRFYCNNVTIPCTKISESTHSAVVQGIVGAAYFMDDFTWFGLDYRYITTQKVNVMTSRVEVHTINLSFNGMFYCA